MSADDRIAFSAGLAASPFAIKVVPEQYGIYYQGQSNTDPETRIAFSIVAVAESSHGSAQVTLVSGYASRAEAETRAMMIRSEITAHGDIPEALELDVMRPVVQSKGE